MEKESKSMLDVGAELVDSLLEFTRKIINSDSFEDLELAHNCLSLFVSMTTFYGFPSKEKCPAIAEHNKSK